MKVNLARFGRSFETDCDWLPCAVAEGCEEVCKALYWPADAPSANNSSMPATKWPTGWRVWPGGGDRAQKWGTNVNPNGECYTVFETQTHINCFLITHAQNHTLIGRLDQR